VAHPEGIAYVDAAPTRAPRQRALVAYLAPLNAPCRWHLAKESHQSWITFAPCVTSPEDGATSEWQRLGRAHQTAARYREGRPARRSNSYWSGSAEAMLSEMLLRL